MGKLWVEVCLISARGLKRTSSLFKLQWYAVGWIDPNNKYCSKIDASGNANPVWKTKFSAVVDNSEANFEDLALHVEVYSREPVFLRESLQGSTTVVLREFLDKYQKDSEVSKPVEEVGSFQLRKRTSNKPQGFVDVSIRISEEREELSYHTGIEDGFKLTEHSSSINLSNAYGSSSQPYPPQYSPTQIHRQEDRRPQTDPPYPRQVPFSSAHSSSSVAGPSNPTWGARPTTYPNPPVARPSYPPCYQPARTPPPPPPPPSNVGYIPTFLPRAGYPESSYINMPPSAAPGRGGGAGGFGVGLGAGALAAGVIFGDDFMSGFDVLGGRLQDPSLTVVADPPF